MSILNTLPGIMYHAKKWNNKRKKTYLDIDLLQRKWMTTVNAKWPVLQALPHAKIQWPVSKLRSLSIFNGPCHGYALCQSSGVLCRKSTRADVTNADVPKLTEQLPIWIEKSRKAATQSHAGSFGRPGRAAALAAGHRGLVTWRSSILEDLAHLAVPAVTHEKVRAAYRHANTFLCACLAVRQTCSRLNIWNYGCSAHACNDANATNIRVHVRNCVCIPFVHKHFGVYQVRDETWLVNTGLHFHFTSTSFKSGRAFAS